MQQLAGGQGCSSEGQRGGVGGGEKRNYLRANRAGASGILGSISLQVPGHFSFSGGRLGRGPARFSRLILTDIGFVLNADMLSVLCSLTFLICKLLFCR